MIAIDPLLIFQIDGLFSFQNGGRFSLNGNWTWTSTKAYGIFLLDTLIFPVAGEFVGIYVKIRLYIYIYLDIFESIFTYEYFKIWIYIYVTCIYLHLYSFTYIYIYSHIYIVTYIQSHIYIYIFITNMYEKETSPFLAFVPVFVGKLLVCQDCPNPNRSSSNYWWLNIITTLRKMYGYHSTYPQNIWHQ